MCPEDPWPHSRGGLPVETTSQQFNQSTVKDHHDQHRDDNLEDDGSGMRTTSMETDLRDNHEYVQSTTAAIM